MDLREQYVAIDQFYQDALSVISSRQSDYAPDGVVLLNLLNTCVRTGVTPVQGLGVLLDKQLTALARFFKDGRLDSDPPASRLRDAVNYYAFIHLYLTRRDDIHNGWHAYWLARSCQCHALVVALETGATIELCQKHLTLKWLVNADRA